MSAPFHTAILITPQFNLAATTAFIDPLRAANYLHGGNLYRWRLLSLEGGSIFASNGLEVLSMPLDKAGAPDLAMVSASWNPEKHARPAVLSRLRKWERFGAWIGALDTGAFILAEAGLLTGRQAVVHFEHRNAFSELYPDIEIGDQLYAVSPGRWMACGGMASADLALHLIRSRQGTALANEVARYIFHERLRGPQERQQDHEPVSRSLPPKLKHAIGLMETHIEDPLPLGRIASLAGLSQRHMERLFQERLNMPPARYYVNTRLERARTLLIQTSISVREIAVACGFSNPEHFSRSYRALFGLPPKKHRLFGRVPFEFRHQGEPSIVVKNQNSGE